MSGYSTWLDAKVDPARGVSGLRLLWNQHWIVVLHTAIIVAILIAVDWLFVIETRSIAYYLLGAVMILTPFVTVVYLWARRAKLFARLGSGVRSNG